MIDLNLIKKHKLKPPFFVYKSSIIKRQFLKLKNSLPCNFVIFYSAKANPNIHILGMLKKLGANVEISSSGELQSVLNTGFNQKQIIFTGPGKTNEELKHALTQRIYLIVVESLNELERIEKIACKLKMKQNILLRINPTLAMRQSNDVVFNFSGSGQKFGIDENQFPGIIKCLKRFKNIKLLGVHLFSGSNVCDEKIILDNTKYLFEIVNDLESRFSIDLSVVDIGGGLGISYSANPNDGVNFNKLSHGFQNLVDKYKFNNKKIILEIGRFLVGESGEYVVRVIDKKKSGKDKFVIVDGGKNHLSMASLSPNGHWVELLNRERSNKKEIFNLVGNLNTSYDFISTTFISKDIQIDDLLSIKNVGAYSFSIGWILFSSRPIPGEYLLLEKGRLKNISKNIKILDE